MEHSEYELHRPRYEVPGEPKHNYEVTEPNYEVAETRIDGPEPTYEQPEHSYEVPEPSYEVPKPSYEVPKANILPHQHRYTEHDPHDDSYIRHRVVYHHSNRFPY